MSETITSRCETQRGRRIPRDTVLRLIAAGAGWCYRPDCDTGSLWYVVDNGNAVRLAEVAHIIAAGEEGPRADPEASDDELTHFDNLLLLCPNCHTIIDKAPGVFPLSLIRQWKARHESRLREFLGVSLFEDRSQLNREITFLLEENRAYWARYGPDSDNGQYVTSNATSAWKKSVTEKIIPNNQKVICLLGANRHLLSREEESVAIEFGIHAEGLMRRHLFGEIAGAPRFPGRMNDLFA